MTTRVHNNVYSLFRYSIRNTEELKQVTPSAIYVSDIDTVCQEKSHSVKRISTTELIRHSTTRLRTDNLLGPNFLAF